MRRMGRAQRNPSSSLTGIDGYRFALPILRAGIVSAHSKASQMTIHAPSRTCSFRGCSPFGDLCASCRRRCGCAGVRQCDLSAEFDDLVEHRQIRDLCGERIRQRVARQEDHRRSHVQDPRARESLSEGNARARIWRTHSFHHLQADRPRTTLSHRSRRALRDDGRQFLLRLADGVWRHLPDVPRCRARQGVAEAVGFQGREGERRRSDGVDVAQG